MPVLHVDLDNMRSLAALLEILETATREGARLVLLVIGDSQQVSSTQRAGLPRQQVEDEPQPEPGGGQPAWASLRLEWDWR